VAVELRWGRCLEEERERESIFRGLSNDFVADCSADWLRSFGWTGVLGIVILGNLEMSTELRNE